MNWEECFTYQPADGTLTWKSRPIEHFKSKQSHAAWNTQYAGTRAGCLSRIKGGRLRYTVYVGGRSYLLHRIVWELHHGTIPKGLVIDHIDRVPTNNKISNLRLATITQNRHNTTKYNNSRPYVGVCYGWTLKDGTKRWKAVIDNGGKKTYLGTFNTAEEARDAYNEAAALTRGEFVPKPALSKLNTTT